jgi:outer membrane DcaP-like protein
MGNVARRLRPRHELSRKGPRCQSPATLKIGPALTAATALLTSFPAARADEVAELQVKQALLKERIEQLAAHPGGAIPAGSSMLGGSFPRSFLIPGSDTSIRVGGFVDETFDYYFQNGPPNGTQSTTVGITGNLATQALDVYGQTVPGLPTPGNLAPVNITHSRGRVFLQSARESRLSVETRTPTSWGDSRSFVEFDFAGCNNFSCQNLLHYEDSLVPRLRYAYATLGGFLGGQASSNFADPDANPETLDFGGPAGLAGVNRIPQVRYTSAGPWGSALSFSAEAPDTDVLTPGGLVEQDTNIAPGAIANTGTAACVANGVTVAIAGGCVLAGDPARNGAPDVTFAWYWTQPWGHFDVRLVGRDLEFNDGRFVNKKFFGYGGGLSGDVKPGWFGWAKDDLQWQFTVGNGIGRYLSDSTNAALATNYTAVPATIAAAANVIVKPITAIGATVGYQHWWQPDLRSTLALGYDYYGVPSQLVGPLEALVANKRLTTLHSNLIWSPAAFIDTGLEYHWGQRQVVANLYGTQQVLIGKFRVKF